MMYFDSIILAAVFNHTSCADLGRAQQVCKFWRDQVLLADLCWKKEIQAQYVGVNVDWLIACYSVILASRGEDIKKLLWKEIYFRLEKIQKFLAKKMEFYNPPRSPNGLIAPDPAAPPSSGFFHKIKSLLKKEKGKSDEVAGSPPPVYVEQQPNPDEPIKIKWTLLGADNVGKTSLIKRIFYDTFEDNEPSTIGAAFKTITVSHAVTGLNFKLEIWDTAGQERYTSLGIMYYRGSQMVAVLYSIDSRYSFDRARVWLQELVVQWPDINFIIIATKCDAENRREVPSAEGIELAKEYSALYMETSAKNRINIMPLMHNMLSSCFFYYNMKKTIGKI